MTGSPSEPSPADPQKSDPQDDLQALQHGDEALDRLIALYERLEQPAEVERYRALRTTP